MRVDDWQHVEAVFHEALARPPGERAAFLAGACGGDEELRQEVESLLAYHDREDSFIERPAFTEGARLIPPDGEGQASRLAPGRRLGHYEILSLLGAGGMGEVYLAEDTRLGRRVALKLLSDSLTRDDGRLRRFRREAFAASALNHPNILTIHEAGEEDGLEFIATEYVDGQTLRERVAAGRLRPGEALDVAAQVASALSAAHAAGIVHRDIKPENVMLRPDGFVKVLDFGLAKLAAKSAARPPADAAAARTATGAVMGTAGYMSPEQARGLEVDARTDVWSLGVVLYEMLTGERPFRGETTGDMIVSVLEREPPPLAQRLPGAPGELQRIVRKALRKEREERYQTAKDLALDLKNLSRELEVEAALGHSSQGWGGDSGSTAGGDEASAGGGVRRAAPTGVIRAAHTASSAEYIVSEIRRHKRGAAVVFAAFALLVAGAGFGLYKLFGPAGRPASARDVRVTRVTAAGSTTAAAITPDGKYVVYAVSGDGQQSLWVRQVATAHSMQIVAPARGMLGGATPSRDGNYIYYNMVDREHPGGVLYQVSVLGGAPQKVLENVNSAVTFSPDGSQFAFVRGTPGVTDTTLMVANTDGTGERALVTRRMPDYFWDAGPAWSPDGKGIACAAVGGGTSQSAPEPFYVVEVSAADGSERAVTRPGWVAMGRLAWLADGSGLVMSAANKSSGYRWQLWQVSYPGGELRRVTNDLSEYHTVGLAADSDTLVTVQSNFISDIWVAPTRGARRGPGVDAARARRVTSGRKDGAFGLSWTPDGRIAHGNADYTIWMTDPGDGSQRLLTKVNELASRQPVVSPDGRYVVYQAFGAGEGATGTSHVWRMNADGGSPKQLTNGYWDFRPQISPDGRWVYYHSLTANKPNLWKVPIEGGDAVRLTDYESHAVAISPDGKLLACLYKEPPAKIMILPSEGGPPVKLLDIPYPFGGYVRWTPDGRGLAYRGSSGGGVSNLWSLPVDGGPPVQLTDFESDGIFSFDWSPDGEWLALSRGTMTHDVVLISDFR